MNNTELSIQINLGGFSFALRSAGLELFAGSVDHFDFSLIKRDVYSEPVGRVKVVCSNAYATVVPAEVYDPLYVETYLDALNMRAKSDVSLAVATAQAGAMVVWGVAKSMVEAVQSQWPNAVWSHALAELIDNSASERSTVVVATSHNMAYIVVRDQDGSLCAARSAEYLTGEDLLFFVRQISVCDTYNVFGVVLVGDVEQTAEDILRRYYADLRRVEDHLFMVRR